MSRLIDCSEITEIEWDDLGVELDANTGKSGDMIYEYYFEVPHEASSKLLKRTSLRPVFASAWA